MKIAFIIPTMNRKVELKRFLRSVYKQSVLPDQVVIVDGSKNPMDYFLLLDYIHAPGLSLTKSRNLGISKVNKDIDLIAFFDDDIVLHKNAISEMMEYWSTASKDVGGSVFNIMNDKLPIFAGEQGLVLRSGFNTPLCRMKETQFVQWLFGGATVWRKEVFNNFKFDEWYENYGYVEDLDFSYRVGMKYKLAVVSEAKVDHLHNQKTRSYTVRYGKKIVLARYHFIEKDTYFSKGYFFISVIGDTIKTVIKAIVRLKFDLFLVAIGNIMALIELRKKW